MSEKFKDDLIILGISVALLLDCIALYFLMGLYQRFGFPTKEVVYALPLALLTYGISALADPKKYATVTAFFATMIFGMSVFTGMFIMLFNSK